MATTLQETIRRCTAYLAERGVDSPGLSARLLAGEALGLDRVALVRESGRELTDGQVDAIDELVRRRGEGEPVAYILGEKEFYGLPMQVGPGVLVPRPETELLIDAARRLFPSDAKLVFADLGAGSGCVAAAVARYFPNARGLALDLSPSALDTVSVNADRHGVGDRLLPVLADFTRPFAAAGSLDLVLANPPYVGDEEYAGLDREVLLFEPESALRGGPKGSEAGLALMSAASPALKPGGALLMEIGHAQAERFRAASPEFEAPFRKVEILHDLAGLHRVFLALKNG